MSHTPVCLPPALVNCLAACLTAPGLTAQGVGEGSSVEQLIVDWHESLPEAVHAHLFDRFDAVSPRQVLIAFLRVASVVVAEEA